MQCPHKYLPMVWSQRPWASALICAGLWTPHKTWHTYSKLSQMLVNVPHINQFNGILLVNIISILIATSSICYNPMKNILRETENSRLWSFYFTIVQKGEIKVWCCSRNLSGMGTHPDLKRLRFLWPGLDRVRAVVLEKWNSADPYLAMIASPQID